MAIIKVSTSRGIKYIEEKVKEPTPSPKKNKVIKNVDKHEDNQEGEQARDNVEIHEDDQR